LLILCQAAWITPAPHLVQGLATAFAYGPGDIAPAAAASFVHNRAITCCTPVYQTQENWSNTSGALSCRQRSSADPSNLPCHSSLAIVAHVMVSLILGSGVLGWCSHKGLWRNGSVSDSRAGGWEFESLWPHFVFAGTFAIRQRSHLCGLILMLQ
jgi:hypothetical protein